MYAFWSALSGHLSTAHNGQPRVYPWIAVHIFLHKMVAAYEEKLLAG